MNTELIYVNKESAYVKNEINGQFINEVPSVIVKAGDLISVESIAVATDGTGSDVIEVPRTIKDYVYQTNKIALEFMYYIHANFKYTCNLPLNVNGAGSGQTIYSDNTLINYGDLNPDIFTRTHNQDYEPKNRDNSLRYAGGRLYIGSFGNDGADPRFPAKSETVDDPLISTGNKVFNFLTTTIPIGVDFGYNSPNNITSQITFDLHNSMFTPNKNNDINPPDPVNFYEPNYSNNNPSIIPLQQATCASENSSVETIFGLPNQYFGKTADPAKPFWYSTYSNFLAVKNPFYWYYGTRLQAQLPNGTEKMLNWAGFYLGPLGRQSDIFNLNELRNNTIDTEIEGGDIMVTSLPFTENAISKLSNFIHAEKLNLFSSLGGQTREGLIKGKKNLFYTNLTIGKYDDGATQPELNPTKLRAKFLTLADTAEPTNVRTASYYQGRSYIDSSKIANFGTITGLGVVGGTTITIDGVDYDNAGISELYDINIVMVEAVTPNLPVQYHIGIILLQQTIPNALIRSGNFCVFDSTFTRDQSQSCMILSSSLSVGGNKHTLNDMVKGLNIGAPNIDIFFDADRSKFSFRNMYWANRIGNQEGEAAIPDAETEVITLNKFDANGQFYKFGGKSAQMVYTQYAQSGLGLYNYYVYDSNDNQVLVNPKIHNDLETKYNKSLLWRLGFEYDDLFNTFGLSNVFFQERFMFGQTPVKYPQYFPYPLTCNPEVDTAFNQSINVTDDGNPTFNLELERNCTNINISVQTAQILARNKPTKLATPFWIIESDIVDAIKYSVDSNPRNVVAIVNRAYGSGDIVYSFATDYKFIATKSFVISHIKTNILTSDLQKADIDDSTTIVYKVESPIMPNFVSAQQEMELEEEMMKGKK